MDDPRCNDDRTFADAHAGLACVVDASGPTYGGYYAPFAVDAAIDALVAAWSRGSGSTADRLVGAVGAAHEELVRGHAAFERARGGRTGLDATRAAADAVRPAAWRGLASNAHFTASMTACATGDDGVVVVQVGDTRAYGVRDGAVTQLVPDHLLVSQLEASGASREDLDEMRRVHGTTVTKLLGMDPFAANVVAIPRPSRIILVTNGAWRASATVEALAQVRSYEDTCRVLARAAADTHDDASAVVIDVGDGED